ncbi:MAG: helix-turn-helix transcriptional regulator [Myxococcaceae bacterium]|nr:helix-turn-helix transcriptional regulator [Myxococcaceae bacterium]
MDPEALQTRVAGTLKRIRTDRGWTLEELARRSGVSRAMLSQIEARKTNPTIAVLWKISTAFGMQFSALLGEQPGQDVTVLRRPELQVLSSADGAFVSRPLFPRNAERKAELYELRLKPGKRSDGPPHPPGTRENLVVVKGRLNVWVGGRKWEVGEGDAIDFAADLPHAYENPGKVAFLGYEVILYR